MAHRLLAHLALSDDGFLFDSSSGNTYSLNSTGAFILKKLIDGSGRDQIVAAMIKVYDTSEDAIARDLNQFFQYLLELNIIKTLPEACDS